MQTKQPVSPLEKVCLGPTVEQLQENIIMNNVILAQFQKLNAIVKGLQL